MKFIPTDVDTINKVKDEYGQESYCTKKLNKKIVQNCI